jgi:malonate-semialdehyde dehydrogenase (acetylating)/methylmalonate-semialdehyde dehydrogenase
LIGAAHERITGSIDAGDLQGADLVVDGRPFDPKQTGEG